MRLPVSCAESGAKRGAAYGRMTSHCVTFRGGRRAAIFPKWAPCEDLNRRVQNRRPQASGPRAVHVPLPEPRRVIPRRVERLRHGRQGRVGRQADLERHRPADHGPRVGVDAAVGADLSRFAGQCDAKLVQAGDERRCQTDALAVPGAVATPPLKNQVVLASAAPDEGLAPEPPQAASRRRCRMPPPGSAGSDRFSPGRRRGRRRRCAKRAQQGMCTRAAHLMEPSPRHRPLRYGDSTRWRWKSA